jgi:hypothetical protein
MTATQLVQLTPEELMAELRRQAWKANHQTDIQVTEWNWNGHFKQYIEYAKDRQAEYNAVEEEVLRRIAPAYV